MKVVKGAIVLSPDELTRLNRLQMAISNAVHASIESTGAVGPFTAEITLNADGEAHLVGVTAGRALRDFFVSATSLPSPSLDAEPIPGLMQIPLLFQDRIGTARPVVVTDEPEVEDVRLFLQQFDAVVQADYDGLSSSSFAILDLPVERIAAFGSPPCPYLPDVRTALRAPSAPRTRASLQEKDRALLEAALAAPASDLRGVLLFFDDVLLGPGVFRHNGDLLVPCLTA